MIHHVFLLIPSDIPSGPVKGAYALANSLVNYYSVTLVTIKRGFSADSYIDIRVRHICLSDHAFTYSDKLKFYRGLLLSAGRRDQILSLSLCLSADLLNVFCKSRAITSSSVRGNLFVNYFYDYGFLGLALAFFHLSTLRRIDKVIAMNGAMAQQVYKVTNRKPHIISNFIDESLYKSLESSRSNSGSYQFLFLGSLSSRKQPSIIVRALKEIIDLGIDASLNFIGSGPEITTIENLVHELGLHEHIKISGFVDRPASSIVQSDVLVLPSISEGISRAAMEALFLGVPCVLRDVDGARELITHGANGATFCDDTELVTAMLHAAEISRRTEFRHCLLPRRFRQDYVIHNYLSMINTLNHQYL